MQSQIISTPGALNKIRYNPNGSVSSNSSVVQSQRYKSVFPIVHSSDSDGFLPTDWQYRVLTSKATNISVRTRNVDGTSESVNGYLAAVVPGSYDQSVNIAPKQLALDRCLDELRGDVDLSIDAFQAKSTAQLARLDHHVGKVIQIVRDIKHLHGAKALKGVGGIWLETQYGLLPTLSTIHSLLDPTNPTREYIRAKGKAKEKVLLATTNKSVLPGIDYRFSLSERRAISVKAKALVEIIVSNPVSGSPASISRYTSMNPLSIGWELLPFSFVVDWFVNIGGFIRNVETAFLFQSLFKCGFSTTTTIYDEYVTSLSVTPTPGNSLISSSFVYGNSRTIEVRRIPYTLMPFPRRPQVKASLGSGRMLNAAALLSQFLK